jgi:HPr Serine kinase C-terminal domain
MAPGSVRWLKIWNETGGDEFKLGRDRSGLVADWGGVARLRASRDGRWHEVTFSQELALEHREKLRRGPVRALLRHLSGAMTLHGSAVSLGGRAVVFVGSSGSGKSTAAADLCQRLGAQLLADDLVSIDEVDGTRRVFPTDIAHWLLPDAMDALGLPPMGGGAKALVMGLGATLAATSEGAILDAIVLLGFDEATQPPTLRPLRGLERFDAINGGYVRFVVDEPLTLVHDLDRISALSAAVPMFGLARRRSLVDLPDVARVLLELMGRLAHEKLPDV